MSPMEAQILEIKHLIVEQGKKIDVVNAHLGKVETRLGGLDTRVEDSRVIIGKVETRLGGLESKVEDSNTRIEEVETFLGGLETRVEDSSTIIGKVETRLGGLESKVEDSSTIIGKVETHVGSLANKIDYLEDKFDHKLQALEDRLSGAIEEVDVKLDTMSLALHEEYIELEKKIAA